MTDEEMAEEYVLNLQKKGFNCFSCFSCDFSKNLGFKSGVPDSEFFNQVEQAYLAGLKAGKGMNVPAKWHDLRKDPTDVPNENVTVLLLTEVGPVTARYYNEYEAFFRLNDKLNYCVFIAPMSYIAWCEIPEYTEE